MFQTGNRVAPTAPSGDSSKRVANTEFVTSAIGSIPSPLPTATVTGSLYYWNGTAVTVLAGNTGTTAVLQETSAGVPSWSTFGTFNATTAGLVPASGGGTINFLRADGAFAQPQGRVLLNTINITSGSTTVDDTTSFTNAHDEYEVLVEGLIPSANALMRIKIYAGGVLQSSSYSYNGGSLGGSNNGQAQVSIGDTNVAAGGDGVSGYINLYNTNSSLDKFSTFGMVYRGNLSATPVAGAGGFIWAGTAVVTGIQFSWASGNFTAGKIKVYGLT